MTSTSRYYMEIFSPIDVMEISISLIVGVYEVLGEYLTSFVEHSIYKDITI